MPHETIHHLSIDRTFRQRGCGSIWPVYLYGQSRQRIGDDYRLSNNATGAIEIPATIDGRSVTSIGDTHSITAWPDEHHHSRQRHQHREYAFYGCSWPDERHSSATASPASGSAHSNNCSSLTSITISNSVTSIGNSAFLGTNLTYSSVDGGEIFVFRQLCFLNRR